MTADDPSDTRPATTVVMMTVVPPRWSWGSVLPGVGYGRCFTCRRPWWACEPRIVDYDDPADAADGLAVTRGHFALCTRCWDRADVDQRVLAHRWSATMIASSWTVDQVRRIEAVVRGLAELDDIDTHLAARPAA